MVKRSESDHGDAPPAKREKIALTEKTCSVTMCEHRGVPQPMSNFSKNGDGLDARCKGCMKTYHATRNYAVPPDLLQKTCSSATCEHDGVAQPVVNFFRKKSRTDGLELRCKQCIKKYQAARSNEKIPFLRRLWQSSKGNHKERAKKRMGMGEHTLTFKHVLAKEEKSAGRCAISSYPMAYMPHSDWACSLDRSVDGTTYTDENARLTCLEFNTPAKWTPA